MVISHFTFSFSIVIILLCEQSRLSLPQPQLVLRSLRWFDWNECNIYFNSCISAEREELITFCWLRSLRGRTLTSRLSAHLRYNLQSFHVTRSQSCCQTCLHGRKHRLKITLYRTWEDGTSKAAVCCRFSELLSVWLPRRCRDRSLGSSQFHFCNKMKAKSHLYNKWSMALKWSEF